MRPHDGIDRVVHDDGAVGDRGGGVATGGGAPAGVFAGAPEKNIQKSCGWGGQFSGLFLLPQYLRIHGGKNLSSKL